MDVETIGPVTFIRMERTWVGQRMMPVHCFQVGDTLVDSGLSCLTKPLLGLMEQHRVRRSLLTHHHEDHSGGAAALVRAGVEVHALPETARLLARRFPIHFYEHVLWGPAEPTPLRGDLAPDTLVPLGPYEAQVIAAPGHCDDQITFFVPQEGWLFSGDAFIHEKVRIFRRDEDFAGTLRTLDSLLDLDFDVLYCAHRPRLKGGKEALRQKKAWLEEIEGQTRLLWQKGASIEEIDRRLEFGPKGWFTRIAIGDVSSENMIRSILHGPTPRAYACA